MVIYSIKGTTETKASVEPRGPGELACFVDGGVDLAYGDLMVVGNENYEVLDVVPFSRNNASFKECRLRKIPL